MYKKQSLKYRWWRYIYRSILPNIAIILKLMFPAPSPYRFALILLLFAVFHSLSVGAQNSTWDSPKKASKWGREKVHKERGKIKKFKEHLQQWGLDTNYRQQFSLGGRLNTNGWSGLMYYQKRVSRTQAHFYQLSFSEIKHEKQVKQQGSNKNFPELGNASPFVFGKVNNLYTLQIGHGRELLLLPGVLEGNISISFRAQAGFSLAMLKPYYIKLIYADLSNNTAYLQEERYTEQNKDKFLKQDEILGSAKWSKGLDKITYVPGGYADAAFTLEPQKSKVFIQTITLGTQFALYAKSLPIMAERKAYPYQGSLYVGLALGKRWK